jgi:maltose alpha-D-glucosyltransferase/alpha-amylase
VLATRDPAVLAMRYNWRNNSVVFVHNLDSAPRELAFTIGVEGEHGRLLVNLLSQDHSRAREDGKHYLVLEPYGYRWYRVGGLDYLLRRSDIDTPSQ